MINLRSDRFFILVFFSFLIAGCAYPISKEFRKEAAKELTFSMVAQNPSAYVGSIVIWGGKIVETQNVAGGSQIIVLETPLDYEEMPESEKYSEGRFIAKSPAFLDPEIYKNGGKITVAGEVIGTERKPLGKSEYAYPVIMIKQLHLWRKAPAYPYWYGPYGPYDWNSYEPYNPYWPLEYGFDYN